MSKLPFLCIVLLTASMSVSAETYTVIHDFGSVAGDPDGPVPPGTIAQSRGGAMVTTTPDFQPEVILGKAFRIWPSGSLQVLHQFNSGPWGGLILATDGKFYGTTNVSGTLGLGTIFKMSQEGSVTRLHDFTGGSDGANPLAAPIQSVKGDFYGTTSKGSPEFLEDGTVYSVTKYGNFKLLHTFTRIDGAQPNAQLVQGTDYYFYGTTRFGGGGDNGTIFRISSSGDFKVLVNLDGTNGEFPYSGLIQANDGNFYGLAYGGGSSGGGVLFRMSPNGTLTVLHNFTGGSDGATPIAGLVQASDGKLYGTNVRGGKNGYGVLFRATLAGDVVPLHAFAVATGIGTQGTLLQHTNGILYGGAGSGGKFGKGVFYSLDAGLPPFVTYLPTYGRPGALVQILGQGFTDTSEVFFNGTPATFKLVYPTYIRATVPDGATSGPITVTTANGTLTSNKVFIVHP